MCQWWPDIAAATSAQAAPERSDFRALVSTSGAAMFDFHRQPIGDIGTT
jgi:hypothetical protein